jgi:diaminopimelate epimerase
VAFEGEDGSVIRVVLGKAEVLGTGITVASSSDLPGEMAAQLRCATQVQVGNPHCVFFPTSPREHGRQLATTLGPLVENASQFPGRTNVQFAWVVGPGRLWIEIWERGAGYTRASGSSSCAAAVAAVATGRCGSPMAVEMPGGQLDITVIPDGAHYQVSLAGPVTPVFHGRFDPRWIASPTEPCGER